ncbi:MAG: bifunctional 5,10-methylenetetrahydrofolate dehydrogenase/5,10-methenyltetrahydrofolate cyclohydrolase [Candidatus Buchananbacteria bacterium]|jgi:methylenetetrahydrofolate dehydrogenase (NADP+)/methenyltetrahydrofolate cyclohydrolase
MSRTTILDGKALADNILLDVKNKILKTGITPGLAAILIGRDPASEIYVRLKEKAAEKIGIVFSKYLADNEIYADIDEFELRELIKFLNKDPQIDGILLQLPLPEGFDQDKMVKLIDSKKDADGFNGGDVIPPTVAAIIELLKATNEKLEGKKTLIIGKSDIFTQEIEKYLKKILNIEQFEIKNSIPDDCNTYDIIIIAVGQAQALKKPAVKPGAIIIDVGINKLDGVTVGDVDPECEEIAGFISPVPGGVGPLTVALLMQNVFELAQKNR